MGLISLPRRLHRFLRRGGVDESHHGAEEAKEDRHKQRGVVAATGVERQPKQQRAECAATDPGGREEPGDGPKVVRPVHVNRALHRIASTDRHPVRTGTAQTQHRHDTDTAQTQHTVAVTIVVTDIIGSLAPIGIP